MTIKEITEESIDQSCEVCGHVRTANLDDLTIGVVTEEHINPNVIPMPPCESCGATEFLIPSKEDAPDHPSPGSIGHRHAMLVDVLNERLVARGRLIPELESKNLKKKKRNKDELDRWFKEGLKLAKPPRSEPKKKSKSNENEEPPHDE